MPPLIVTLGGGTGQSVLLAALRRSRVRAHVTAIVGVTDDGGHSGTLRRALAIPQVGDLRSCLEALAPDGPLAHLVRHRFREGELDGVQVGNPLLAALCRTTGSLSKAAAALSSLLGVPETVLPVSDGNSQLAARLPRGRVVIGEWAIIRALRALRGRPSHPVRLFHTPPLTATPAVRTSLARAHWVLLAPGSLRTALGSLLLVRGVRAALARSRARIVFFVNLMTQPGNTDGFTARDHVDEVSRFLPRPPDVVVLDRRGVSPALVRAYARTGGQPVVDDLGDDPRVLRVDLAERPDARRLARYARAGKAFAAGPHLVRHDPAALARLLTRLFRAD